ncbi:hypothetical protein K493DRAFT_310011 [Basidiobolus meristosporus CBS 931.73]|uniref:C2H2-type domain-containing protein n=1 Tax=Basidiobolus meristosporus CBS 931.73 TaxID=1314790 RepID=A0A1Y1ZCM3_9FUNG|nr:hypothetical protein K493DRAFT_310011 [Basidiobolus meristosporus CBS 931.73]|eukprot:ORY07998.1 hypothetical protein K493DRAFT_310011 [Basidiobolus meristosporus CBS 931.73]
MQVIGKIHTNQFPKTWYSCPFGNCSCKFKTYDFVKRHVLNHHMNTFSRCDSDYCETCISHMQSSPPQVRAASPNAQSKRKRSPSTTNESQWKSHKQTRVRDSTSPPNLTTRTDSPVSETPNTPQNINSPYSPKPTSPSLPSIRTIFNMDKQAHQPLPSPNGSLGHPGSHNYAVPSLPSLEELSFTSVTYSYNPWSRSTTIYPCQVSGCNMKFDRMEHLNRHLHYHPPEDSRSYGPNNAIPPPL